MRATLCAVCIGIVLLGLLPDLSRLSYLLPAFPIIGEVLGYFLPNYRRRIRVYYVCALFGATWHGVWAQQRLHNIIPASLEGIDLLITGRITTIPVTGARGQRFEFEVIETHNGFKPYAGSKLLLSTFRSATLSGESNETTAAYTLESVKLGQVWQLLVRLKRPHGYANPGGIDRESFYLRRGIVGTGYVRTSDQNIYLDAPLSTLTLLSLRSGLWSRLYNQLHSYSQKGLMLALLLGEKSLIERSVWDVFSRTGTTHLFVISGLHIGLVAFAAYSLLWRLLALILGPRYPWPTQFTAALFALLASVFYAALAGFSLPTQRACVMAAVFLIGIPLGLRLSMSTRFLLALTFVLLLDPLATTSSGFWLSFTAVAVLILFAQEHRIQSREQSLPSSLNLKLISQLRAQSTVFVGLLVPLLAWLGQVSLIAPLVNLLAIPLVGFAIVPLLILGLMLSFLSVDLGIMLFTASNFMLKILVALLSDAAALSGAKVMSVFGVSVAVLLAAALGSFVILLPGTLRYRCLAIPLFLPLFFPSPDRPNQNELWVDVIDVGQGLSVLLRTAAHTLLFDTGPGEAGGWTAAEMLVVPTMKKLGVSRLDRLIVSHSDSDHASGLSFISRNYPETDIVGHELVGDGHCQAGESWVWDGVSFEFLHPDRRYSTPNNNSCVLRVQAGRHAVLLPGDVEADVEWELASSLGGHLKSYVLLAAHHGSATSSSYPFIKMVDPEYVVFSAGYRNGFAHPAESVQRRYADWGIQSFNTANSGMLSFRLGAEDAIQSPGQHRQEHRHYWSWSEIPLPCRYC